MYSKRKKPPTILVVEDEPTIRALAEAIIEARGYKTLSAATAREAVALLERENSVDLLFTDIVLPDGPEAIDGLELARRAGALRPGMRVVYTSGGGRTDGLAALFVDNAIFLAKPYTNDQLIEALEDAFAIDKSRASA